MKRHLILMMIVGAVMMVPSANASVCTTTDCTYTFDTTAVGAFGAGPYGTVELTLNGSAIDFTLDLAAGFILIDTGTHEAFTFNDTLGGGVTVSNLSDSTNYSQGTGPFNNPGFSTFTDGLISTTCTSGGSSGCANSLTFEVTRTGGFSNVQQLVALSTGSGTAAYFSADVGLNGSTGTIGVSAAPRPLSTVPEPITSGLVGSGLIALFFVRRRVRG